MQHAAVPYQTWTGKQSNSCLACVWLLSSPSHGLLGVSVGSSKSAEVLTNEHSQCFPAHIRNEGLGIMLYIAWLVGPALGFHLTVAFGVCGGSILGVGTEEIKSKVEAAISGINHSFPVLLIVSKHFSPLSPRFYKEPTLMVVVCHLSRLYPQIQQSFVLGINACSLTIQETSTHCAMRRTTMDEQTYSVQRSI